MSLVTSLVLHVALGYGSANCEVAGIPNRLYLLVSAVDPQCRSTCLICRAFYRVAQKTAHYTLVHTFAKYSPTYAVGNLQ